MCNGALAHFTVVNRQWLIVSKRLDTQALHDFWLHLLFDLKEVKRPLSGTNNQQVPFFAIFFIFYHSRYNIFKKKPNSKQINSHRYNNPAYSTQETTNRYSEIDIVQTPNPYENSSSLPQHESEIYYSEVANESSAEEKAGNVYYEPQTAYGDSGEAGLSVVSSQAGLRDSTGDTEIYFLADEVKDDLVVVDNDLYRT